jgi:hypothetical protein
LVVDTTRDFWFCSCHGSNCRDDTHSINQNDVISYRNQRWLSALWLPVNVHLPLSSQFAHGSRDCCFLAALANWRGDDALEWFSADLPKNIEVVDGFDESPMPIDIDTMSAYSKGDSKLTGGEASEIDRIVNAIKRGPNESPEKRAYFQQKTKLFRVKEEALRVGGQVTKRKCEMEKRKSDMELARELRKGDMEKRKSDIELARELRLESKAQDSDDEDDNALKNRMKSASRRIFARILKEVEGETAAATLQAATSP